MFKASKGFAGLYLKENDAHNPGDDVDPTLIIRKSSGGVSFTKSPTGKMTVSIKDGSNLAIQTLTVEDIKKLKEFLK